MINLSFAGLLGAIVGTVVAAVSYHLAIGFLEGKLMEWQEHQPPQERLDAELSLTTMRRLVLIADLALFAGVGYWLGAMLGD